MCIGIIFLIIVLQSHPAITNLAVKNICYNEPKIIIRLICYGLAVTNQKGAKLGIRYNGVRL